MELSYKNNIDLKYKSLSPKQRREELSKNIVQYANFLPQTLTYEDIDRSFKEWVEKEIPIYHEGVELPTMVLYSNQRFSEYLQTWKYTDENNNIRINFKTVTRENNPKHGSIIGDTFNIPGERYFNIKTIDSIDENGRKCKLVYKMRQPTPVDFLYKVSIVTNKYTNINEFNEKVNRLFNSRQCYIYPNNHYISIMLDNISDESEYNNNDRQFFVQTISLIVKGYIITEDDYKVEQIPLTVITCFEGDDAKRKKPSIELIEYDCIDEEGNIIQPIDIDISFNFINLQYGKIRFIIDEDFTITNLKLNNNSNIVEDTIKLFVNDILITNNLKEYAFEGYKLCDYEVLDATDENTIKSIDIPKKEHKEIKYILCDGKYYKWHKIKLYDGDEIVIKTERLNKRLIEGRLILNGYNLI